jgi:hypothetical protein|tara:strand:+ start:179 stop:379 length:201 start_codon:yes stop_codon:yes gene_type:complete
MVVICCAVVIAILSTTKNVWLPMHNPNESDQMDLAQENISKTRKYEYYTRDCPTVRTPITRKVKIL